MIINIYEIYISAFPTIYYLNNLRCFFHSCILIYALVMAVCLEKRKENVN